MIKDLIIANRSVRGYDQSRKVAREELLEMVDCARLTSSSVNKQPLKYMIVDDEDGVALLRASTKLGAMLPMRKLPDDGKEPPAYILICQDLAISQSQYGFANDVGIAAEAITLCATEMGLNACMIGNINDVRIEDALGLTGKYNVRLVVAIGKSAEEIHIVEVGDDEDTRYYRDENDVHYVPKKRLQDVIIKR